MLDHLGVGVSDVARSKSFYAAALKPLGIGVIMEFPGAVGLGTKGKPFFWIGANPHHAQAHIAFLAANRTAVDGFYRAAIAAGGRDNGAPGLRPQYHEHYYGAFVLDPDGYNVEAVCHLPPRGAAVKKVAKRVSAKMSARKKPARKAAKRRPAAKAKKRR